MQLAGRIIYASVAEIMIHSIENLDHTGYDNCDHEPIHIPGSIQSFGFLIAIRQEVKTIEFCSANIEEFTGHRPDAFLSRPLEILFSDAQISALRDYIAAEYDPASEPLTLSFNGRAFDTYLWASDELLILEFEPAPDERLSLGQLYGQVKHFSEAADGAENLVALCQSVTDKTKALTGFDRVMIYRFDQDYNGEVIAESRDNDLEPFLHLHYPQTDIPVQARKLYLKNLVRLIADVTSRPVPLLTLNVQASNSTLDMSQSILRSVSPLHIEYLKNMSVAASFSVSLVHDGRLWGLIACHHHSPKLLPQHVRLSAKMQGHFLTSQIRALEAKDAHAQQQAVANHQRSLQLAIHTVADFVADHHKDPELLQLVNASGVLIVRDGKFYQNGVLPDETTLPDFVEWLSTRATTGHLHTDSLMELYPKARALGPSAAGILYHSLGVAAHNCIIWFRTELAKTVLWAGNPEESLNKQAAGAPLSPRKSFAAWQQVVRDKSDMWSNAELGAAATFSYALEKQLHLTIMAREEKRYRVLTEQLTEANEELSRINWISTHDLKEPLRKIQIFGSRILESDKDQLSESVLHSVSRMRTAAGRMQVLIEDIMSYSRIGNEDENNEVLALDSIIDNVTSLMKAEFEHGGAQIVRTALPRVMGIRSRLEQVFQNLFTNALKYAREGVPLRLQINYETVTASSVADVVSGSSGDYYKIAVADNGIGFDPMYATRVFEVFQRLNNGAAQEGSGVGLAICRKIMLYHNGAITAESTPGAGSTFFLYFPVSLEKSGNKKAAGR